MMSRKEMRMQIGQCHHSPDLFLIVERNKFPCIRHITSNIHCGSAVPRAIRLSIARRESSNKRTCQAARAQP